jgi:hypothetical protein
MVWVIVFILLAIVLGGMGLLVKGLTWLLFFAAVALFVSFLLGFRN